MFIFMPTFKIDTVRCNASNETCAHDNMKGIGSFFGILLLIVFCCCCIPLTCIYLQHCLTGRAFCSNWLFVKCAKKRHRQNALNESLFSSGIWSSRYYQYEKWHDRHELSLSFQEEQNLVTGSGTDDVGSFTIVGTYSTRTLRMGLKKTYRAGTGNRMENLGHTVTIQLKWNSNTNQFEGKWYV